jgi:PAS domain S-box-containing protein
MPESDRVHAVDSEVRETVVLRRAMRDLLALCTIPAAWVGREPDAIAKGVVDVLVTALRVECGYLMLTDDPADVVVMQGNAPAEIVEALVLKCSGELRRAPLVHDLGPAHRAAVVPIRVGSKSGFIAAISTRVDFPTEIESMLMSVAANQAAISLEEAHLLQDRIRAERALRVKEERLQSALTASQRLAAIVDSSDDAIVSKDLNGIVTSWNKSAERLFEYKAEEMIGQPITTVIPPELHHDEERILATIARGERIEHFETIRMKKSGERFSVSLTISPVRNEQGEVVGAAKIARDITQHKRTEKALQLTEKLASVGRLAATVAHELNNPLEAVTNFVFLAQTTENLPAVARKYLTLADQELERVSHIAQQTMGFYRDTSAPTIVDIRGSIDDVLRIFESKLRYKSLTIDINSEPGLKIEALGGEVRQVFSNLISNAIDASPNRGVIKVHGKTVRKDGVQYAQVTFADQGSGIPQKLKTSIFNPFFTTKSDVGTGLGLWVSKTLVEKHGGRIAFRTKSGNGCVFTVQFPMGASRHSKEHHAIA